MFSVKRLMAHLNIPKVEAMHVRRILQLDLRRGVRNEAEESGSPEYEIWHDAPSRKLYMINRVLDGFHGVEIIRSRHDDMHTFQGISYLNTGDSYATTLMYDHGKGKWLLGSWGDVVERSGRRFE